MSAVSSIPPIETFTDACFRLSGQLATIEQRVGVNIEAVVIAGAFDLQTLA
jgi:hypothetical protein